MTLAPGTPLPFGNFDSLLSVHDGNDAFVGGDDWLTAGEGRNLIDAGAGDDVVHATAGRDTLLGGNGADLGFGGRDSAVLPGGDGADLLDLRIISGADHSASGGAGADHFAFIHLTGQKNGHTVNGDFEMGLDRVSVDQADLGLLMQAQELRFNDSAAGAVVTFGNAAGPVTLSRVCGRVAERLFPAASDRLRTAYEVRDDQSGTLQNMS